MRKAAGIQRGHIDVGREGVGAGRRDRTRLDEAGAKRGARGRAAIPSRFSVLLAAREEREADDGGRHLAYDGGGRNARIHARDGDPRSERDALPRRRVAEEAAPPLDNAAVTQRPFDARAGGSSRVICPRSADESGVCARGRRARLEAEEIAENLDGVATDERERPGAPDAADTFDARYAPTQIARREEENRDRQHPIA